MEHCLNAYFIWNKNIVSGNIMFFIPVQSENNQEEEWQTPWNIKLIWLTKLPDYAVLRRLNHVTIKQYWSNEDIHWMLNIWLDVLRLQRDTLMRYAEERLFATLNPGPVQKCVRNIAFTTQESQSKWRATLNHPTSRPHWLINQAFDS